MDYLTVKKAGEKWGLGARIVTLYCADGRIDGAVKKGNLWLVPKDALKPADGRRKNTAAQKEKEATHPFQALFENQELFMEIVQHFPYPMHISEPDGTIFFANEAFLKFAKVSNPENFYGKHNVLHDPDLEKWGIKEYVLRAFQGEIVQAYDIKVPAQKNDGN